MGSGARGLEEREERDACIQTWIYNAGGACRLHGNADAMRRDEVRRDGVGIFTLH